jgi:quercetin dioxygenase-like cupin family protein
MSITLLYRFTEGVNRLTDDAGESSREALTGKVARLTDLVRYQEGAIVSRTIVEKKAGTVTLFAFDRGQKLSEHTAPFDALVCILDGEATVMISGESHQLKEGEAILMRANEPHALEAPTKFKMMLTMIRS